MYILLYGQMDLFTMYEDIEWQASSDFIEAGKHTFSCANVHAKTKSTTFYRG